MTTKIYQKIYNFGQGSSQDINNDPVTYCMGKTIDISFQHGTDQYGQHCKPCQIYMSQRCSKNWDNICEMLSYNTSTSYPNSIQKCNGINQVLNKNMTAGQILLYNTFAQKYLSETIGGYERTEAFDPNVASSPMITYTYGGISIYEVKDYKNIDNCIIMNKILDNPYIALDILFNIYKTMKRKNTLGLINGSRLSVLFNNINFVRVCNSF